MVMIVEINEVSGVVVDSIEELNETPQTFIMSDTRNRRVELQLFMLENRITFRILSSGLLQRDTYRIEEAVSVFNHHASCGTLPRVR